VSDPIGYNFGGTDEGSHYMATRQGFGDAPTPQPTPQQPTEASPSAEAMEAATNTRYIIGALQRIGFGYTEATKALDVVIHAYFAREFARRVEEAFAKAREEVGGLTIRPTDGKETRTMIRSYNDGAEDAFAAALRALGGEGGKRS
jgi:hypothetical protein